ncbi:hypothetical protein ACHAP8_001638 [Fusarium lateritium]
MGTRHTELAPLKSSMYPNLHNYVAESLGDLEYSFRGHDTKVDIKREYDTATMGKFTCRRDKCHNHHWYGNYIAINIREYQDKSYNVLVYHQLCMKCRKSTRADLDRPLYKDRVAYHLKKWNGISAEQRELEVSSNGTHKEKLCQGCIEGHCTKRKLDDEESD